MQRGSESVFIAEICTHDQHQRDTADMFIMQCVKERESEKYFDFPINVWLYVTTKDWNPPMRSPCILDHTRYESNNTHMRSIGNRLTEALVGSCKFAFNQESRSKLNVYAISREENRANNAC